MSEAAFEEQMKGIDNWLSELRSLGINAKKTNVLNDKGELQALADNIKQGLYQDYKTAYGES
jgi:hypothetical protein